MDRHGDVSGQHFLHEFSPDRYHTKISWRYLGHVLLYQTLDLWVETDWRIHEILNFPSRVSILTRTHNGRSSTSQDFYTPRCIQLLRYARVSGQLHSCHQEHTPFDVVAWHGKWVLLMPVGWPKLKPFLAMFLTNMIQRSSYMSGVSLMIT